MLLDIAMLEMLKSLSDPGEPDALREILEIYRDDGQSVLAQLEQAALANDTDRTRRAAHRLKGSSSNLGAVALSNVLAVIERDAPSGITPAIVAEVKQAQALFIETLAGIEAYCQD